MVRVYFPNVFRQVRTPIPTTLCASAPLVDDIYTEQSVSLILYTQLFINFPFSRDISKQTRQQCCFSPALIQIISKIHREKLWINLFWIIRHHVLSNACCVAAVFRKDFKVGIFRRRCFPERDSEIAGLSDEREGR